MCELFTCALGVKGSKNEDKYLRLPFHVGRNKRRAFDYLQVRISNPKKKKAYNFGKVVGFLLVVKGIDKKSCPKL